jgi:hypothetical protein
MRIQNKILVEMNESKRLLGRLKLWEEDTIKMGLGETGCEFMDCIQLAQNRAQ